MKLYVAGPVTGLPNGNKAAFLDAMYRLAAAGYYPAIPHQIVPRGAEWGNAMKLAVGLMVQADGVALLDGWQTSRGARIEHRLARDLGMPACGVDHWVECAELYTKGEE